MKRSQLLKSFGYSQELLDFLMVDDSEEPNSTPPQNPESVFIYSDEDSPLTINADGKLEGGKNINFPAITDLSEDSVNRINKYLGQSFSSSNTDNLPKDEPQNKQNTETINYEEQNTTTTNQLQRTTEINGVDLTPIFELIKLSKRIRETEKQDKATQEITDVRIRIPTGFIDRGEPDEEVTSLPGPIYVQEGQSKVIAVSPDIYNKTKETES
ncbi:MAG: hypothetical protein J6S67_24890 [Methanobrevibacter sp.]|nr:hypothetical protein [Methanobrevibacter sp.]